LKKLSTVGDQGSAGNEDIISRLESRTAQHVFCHEYDEALKDINLWAPEKRGDVVHNLAESFKDEYPEFVARLPEMPKKNVVKPRVARQSSHKCLSFWSAATSMECGDAALYATCFFRVEILIRRGK
jgi:hypothetical protein